MDPAGDLLIADTRNNRFREVTPAGDIATVAGNGTGGFSGDGGPATRAGLGPTSVALDSSGNLLITDVNSARVRMVTG